MQLICKKYLTFNNLCHILAYYVFVYMNMQNIYIGEKMRDYHTIDEIEKGIDGFLPIPKRTQSKYRKEGLLKFFKLGRQIYYRTEHLKEFFIKLEQAAINKAD